MEKQTLFWLFIAIFAITAAITLLGITGVLKNIKEKYLNTLFTALILEVVAAVVLLFQGYNFNEPSFNLGDMIKEAGLPIPERVEDHSGFIVKKLASTIDLEKLPTKITALEADIQAKNNEIESLKGSISRYDQNFYSNIIGLDNALYQITGNSINLEFRPETKDAIYKYLVNIFSDLGRIKEGDGTINSDNSINKAAVRSIYTDFRVENSRPEEAYIDESDIARMVRAYLEYRKFTPQFQARLNAVSTSE